MKSYTICKEIGYYNVGKYVESHKTYRRLITSYHNITASRAKKIAKRYGIKLAAHKPNNRHKTGYIHLTYSKRTRKLTITQSSVVINFKHYKKTF